MNSPFDLTEQNSRVDSRIVAALEKLSEVLRVLLWDESKKVNLSSIQIQIMIFLRYHPAEHCTVTNLAGNFNLTKPTISDSIRSLLDKKLIEKSPDPVDTRSYRILLTDSGREVANMTANFTHRLHNAILHLHPKQQSVMLGSLLHIINSLQKINAIQPERMCFNCVNYQHLKGKHYCHLLKNYLAEHDIRLDCPEHLSINALSN